MPELYHAPNIYSYGDRDDYRCMTAVIGPVQVWFSYTTPVAFKVDGLPKVVHQNVWSRTTGKHLNAIDGGGKSEKARRVNSDAFAALWNEQAAPVMGTAWAAAVTATKTPEFLELVRRKVKLDRGAPDGDHAEEHHEA